MQKLLLHSFPACLRTLPALITVAALISSSGLFPLQAQDKQPLDKANQPPIPATPAKGAETRFDFLDGDRVAFIGDTFMEREGAYGYIETRITSEYPDRNITFRNLGWSGDVPSGQSRVSFDWNKSENEWLRQLREQIAAVKPTVAILGYGMASSFEGEAGLPKFRADLNKLMDAIEEVSKEKPVRFILVSPIRHEKRDPPLPDPARHNAQLALYTQALREIATERKCRFVPLFELLPDGATTRPPRALTDNGIHLSRLGYWRAAEMIAKSLGWKPNAWQVSITKAGEVRKGSFGAKVSGIVKSSVSAKFSSEADNVDMPPLPVPGAVYRLTPPTLLQVLELRNGTYTLKIDGKAVATHPMTGWKGSVVLTNGPTVEQAEELRRTIVKKNELFFYRWRPQNQTYLFGFRKHEQGQNAREIPQFDPLVEEQEKKIAVLRKPAKYTFELTEAEKSDAGVSAAKSQAATAASSSAPEKPSTATSPGASPTTGPSLPNFEVAPGFEINLYAESPQLAKPIQMNFDPQGRLWIASSEVYPQIKPGQTASDKILVLEDKEGDGQAETSTVFADGLLIPTGVEPGHGGVYVGASTELLFFKDNDGDGKADERRVVLSGFGTEDTHHILHTLRWGHDGQLYFNQSIYIHSHIEIPHGVVRLNSGGVWRFRPDTQELGVFLKGFCNPWGHHFDAFGQSFTTDGAGFQGISWGIEGATYFTYADLRREMKSISPGSYPKFCGLEVVESQHFPDDWQGDIAAPDFRAHRIARFKVSELGAGYVTKEMPDFLRTTNVTFRPIDVKLGPDGALYIADWSNPIIQHGEVDFRDPRRDHEHGRIWRVTAKGRPLNLRRDFTKLSNTELLDQLLSPNNYDRQRARRVLSERGSTETRKDLETWVGKHAEENAQLEALWMYQSLGHGEPDLLQRVLAAKDGRIRAAATRVLRYWHNRIPNSADLFARAVADEHPRARVEAIRALSQIPSPRAAELVLSVLDKPMDEFLDYAVWLSINDLAKPWIDSIQSGAWKIEGREKQLEFGLQAIDAKLAAPVLASLLETRPILRDGSGPWIELIGKAGSEKELQLLFDSVLQQKLDDAATARALASLNHAARVRKLKPSGDVAAMVELLKNRADKVRETAARLAGGWKIEQLAPSLLTLARDNSAGVRQAAFESLREIGGAVVFSEVTAMTDQAVDPAIRRQAAQTLASLDLKKGLPAIVAVLKDTSTEADALALWRSLLSNKGAAKTIARGLPKSGFATAAAKAGMRVAREGGRNEPELVLALAQAGGLEDESKNLSPGEIQQLIASARENGDPSRGEKVYRRSDMACATCHAIGGVGGKVGPDLTSIGASAPVDYLVESMLFPNRKIKEGYHSVMIETKDGLELSGIVVRENSEQLIIRDAANVETAVPKDHIQKRAQSGSLMPSGLLDSLSSSEQFDLYRFLSELGKPGPFDASKGNVARLWRVRPLLHTDEQVGEGTLVGGDINNAEWKRVESFVDGRLTDDMLKEGAQTSRYVGVTGIYAATQFQVPRTGPVQLALSCSPHLAMWIDGKPVAASTAITAELTAGTHTFVVKLDPKKLPGQLRLETNDGTFLTN